MTEPKDFRQMGKGVVSFVGAQKALYEERVLAIHGLKPEPLRLNLGAGLSPMVGWTNCDLYPSTGIDLVFDLMGTWPIADNSIQDVYASHVLEHLPDPKAFFRELWRVCRPNASVTIRVPHGVCDSAMSDMDHLRPWFPASFISLQPRYAHSSRCLQHADWEWPFGLDLVQMKLSARVSKMMGHWWWRIFADKCLPHLWDVVEELHAYLYVLKGPEAITTYLGKPDPVNLVRVCYVAWQHEVYGKPLGEKPPVLINVADGSLARQPSYTIGVNETQRREET